MASRKNRKIILSAALCSALMMLSGCAAASMAEYSESSVIIFGSRSGYYDNFTAETEDGGCRIQGTAHLGSGQESSLVSMSAEEDKTATVEGALDCKKGSLRLVYTAADGTETVIAECEDASYEAFDVSLTVTEEESALRISGNGKNEVCDFEIFIAGDGIRFNPGNYGKEEAPEAESPIVDNWPESVVCMADGLNAEPLRFELPIDDSTALSLSCITEEGRLRIQIKDSDGKIIFDEKKIKTEDFEIAIDTPGACTFSVWAEQYCGKFEIRPETIAE